MQSINFKVKRHWWIWALGIVYNLFALKLLLDNILDSNLTEFFNSPQFTIFVVVLIADIIVIRDASHINYNLSDKFLTVKFAIFSKYKVIPLISILEVKGFSLMTFQGFGVQIIESSLAGYRITYRVGQGKRMSLIISPKDKEMFIEELGLRIDKKVILLNNKESAFLNRKDKIL